MIRQWSIGRFRAVALFVAAIMCVLVVSAARAELAVTADPASPVHADTFDLSVLHEFGDTGYGHLDQSISVNGNQIDVDVLMQDLHTKPGSVFAAIIMPSGAFFDDFGPLAAGTYEVNAQMWLTPWPDTGPGYLYDTGSLTFRAAPEPNAAALLLVGAAIAAGTVLRRKLGQSAA
jgi:hypothetical protein